MNESDYTRKLVKAIRARLPHAVTFKHADMFTMGVPDFSVTRGGVTTWFEAKLLDRSKVSGEPAFVRLCPTQDVPAVQWETLRRLVRGYLAVYTPVGHALIHVSGFRESVGQLRLRLLPMQQLVVEVINAAENGCKEIQ